MEIEVCWRRTKTCWRLLLLAEPAIPNNTDESLISFSSKKNEIDHRLYIEKSVHDWCTNNKNILHNLDFNVATDIDYHVQFNSTMDKGEIKCQCGLTCALFLSESGNFKVKSFVFQNF